MKGGSIMNRRRTRRGVMTFRSAGLLFLLVLTIGTLSCAGNKEVKKQADASRRLGESYYRAGEFTHALEEFVKAEKLNSKDPVLHNDLGLVYAEKGDYEQALYHLNKALKLKSHYPEAENNMGVVYSILKQWDRAIECYDRARSDLLYRTPHIALINLGVAYREKEEYHRSVESFEEAIKVAPEQAMVDLANAYRGLGHTYMAMEDHEDALTSFQKAVEKAPDFAAAYYDLGQSYLKLQSFEKALYAFNKVLTLTSDPNLTEKAEAAIMELQR